MQVLNFQSPYRQGESPYDIFKDRMAAITQIIQGIKGRILNKYNKGLMDTTIEGFYKALTPEQATEEINILNAEPGEEIYPGGIEEMAGKFVDTFNMMGALAQRESVMGGQRSMGGIPPTMGTPGTPTSEVMIPKGSQAEILNYIMNMPEGQKMDFKPALKYMQENRPKMMGSFSPMEEWVMNQALGQIEGQESQKEKLSEDLKLAKQYSDYFEEPTEGRPGKYPYTEQEVKDYELWKKSQEAPETQIDFDKLNEFIEANDMKLSGVNVNPGTGNLSYSFAAKSTDKTWGEFIGEANQFIQDNPDYEVTSTNPKTGSVTIEKKGKEDGGLKAPTYSTAESIEKGFMEKVETVQDFGSELKRLQGLGIDTKTFETTEYFAELMKKKHEEALSVIQYCMQGIQSGEEADKDGLNYRDTYKEWWEKANNYDQEYFNVTGKHLLTEK